MQCSTSNVVEEPSHLRAVGRDARRQRTWQEPGGRSLGGPLAGRIVGEGAPRVLLLHGMFNAGRYWGREYDRLAGHGALVVPDLLGFGRSPRPASGYTADAHADAVAETLRRAGVAAPVTVGAHSVGSLVALRLAARHPELVGAVVAFSPPVYASSDEARRQLASVDPLARLFLFNEGIGRWVCGLMCRHRPSARRLVRMMRPALPRALADDRVEHSWASYAETMSNVVLSACAVDWFAEIGAPVTLVGGCRDRAVDLALLVELGRLHPHVRTLAVPNGTHDLPLTRPDVCLPLVQAAARASEP